MVYSIENKSFDPYFNLAFEQFVFDSLDRGKDYFMLWQNNNAIILGKHQNALEEINRAVVEENNISVVRRLSGGGAVYHDLGNLNFTFISTENKVNGNIDFAVFCEPVRKALLSLGVPVEISGRNDMQVEGKKISGNAQYIKEGRVMHHGTILYDSNLDMLSRALNAGEEKIRSKAVKSVRSRVTNVRPYIKNDMPMEEFRSVINSHVRKSLNMNAFTLTPEQYAATEELKEKVYCQWTWNYGNSPPYTMRKVRRFEGCGKIEAFLDIGAQGIIGNVVFFGDFFGSREPSEFAGKLTGLHFKYEDIKTLTESLDVSQYFYGLDAESFLALLFG